MPLIFIIISEQLLSKCNNNSQIIKISFPIFFITKIFYFILFTPNKSNKYKIIK